MGKRFPPPMPINFFGRIGKKKCNKLPLIYLRYLHDIFGGSAWTQGDDEYRGFLDILNNHNSCVKLTSVNNTSITWTLRFLKGNMNLLIRIYTFTAKSRSTHQLLYKDLFHPKHTFSGILNICFL